MVTNLYWYCFVELWQCVRLYPVYLVINQETDFKNMVTAESRFAFYSDMYK